MPSFLASLPAVIGHIQQSVTVLAHQGGWDEFLMVAAPVGIFAALLISANRRAARLDQGDGNDDGEANPIVSSESPRNERGGPI